MGACNSSQPDEPAQGGGGEVQPQSHERPTHPLSVPYDLVFLGPEQSGKSTLYNQMKLRFGEPLNGLDLDRLIPVLTKTMIRMSKYLIGMANSLERKQDCKEEDQHNTEMLDLLTYSSGVKIDGSIQGIILDYLKSMRNFQIEPRDEARALYRHAAIYESRGELQTTVARVIENVWNDPAIQHTYEVCSKVASLESAPYLLSRASNDLMPNQTDYLRTYNPTYNTKSEQLSISGQEFRVFDTNGRSSLAQTCPTSLHAILYVISLSEYDQHICHTDQPNRLVKAIQGFEDVCKQQLAPVFLFLNKLDVFREKIEDRRIPLTIAFKDYSGPRGDWRDALEFVTNKCKDAARRPIFVYPLTAIMEDESLSEMFDEIAQMIRSSVPKSRKISTHGRQRSYDLHLSHICDVYCQELDNSGQHACWCRWYGEPK